MRYINLEDAIINSEMKQNELAERVGIHESRISQLMHKPHIDIKVDVLLRLCNALDLDVGYAVANIRDANTTEVNHAT